MNSLGSPCQFVPPYLLERIVAASLAIGHDCARTLEMDLVLRNSRPEGFDIEDLGKRDGSELARTAAWSVFTADSTQQLPGELVRAAGDPVSGDVAVDEAAAGLIASLELAADYGRDSFDGKGAPVVVTVHFGRNYVNAFWNGFQLVFGDGDAEVFVRFTKPIDVLGHEFAHAVTQYTAGLVYRDQSGALNESLSDVFATCMKQRLLGQRADEADWLIGAELFLPGIAARGLRDMAYPGTAYNDPVLGRDPQVGHLDQLVLTTDDNGGVHINSGIPNRAFYLAATSIGGMSWEGAGRIWWAAMTGGQVRPATDFAGFAAATVASAGEYAAAVEQAWSRVGVGAGAAHTTAQPQPFSSPASGSEPDADATDEAALVVRRSGGFLGRTVEARQSLVATDAKAEAARELVDRVDPTQFAGEVSRPDMFVYSFAVTGRLSMTVAQQQLPDDLQRLADLVLGEDDLE